MSSSSNNFSTIKQTKPNIPISKTNQTNITPRKKPEAILKCVEENPCNYFFDKSSGIKVPKHNGENSKSHRRSNTNTQFIEDMRTNISMQFEKLKEFKETRHNFNKILQQNDDFSQDNEKTIEKDKNTPFYYERENNNCPTFFKPKSNHLSQNFSNYTVKRENKKDYDNFFQNENSESEKKNDEIIKNKSISCHFNYRDITNDNSSNLNSSKMSNKFSCNKTSNYLYGEMKIQEKKNEIVENISNLKQKLYKIKTSKNMTVSMKEMFDLFEDLNDCYKGKIYHFSLKKNIFLFFRSKPTI